MAGSYLQITQGDTYIFTTQVLLDGVEQNIYGSDISLYAVSNPSLDASNSVLINVGTATGEIAISGTNNANITVTLNSNFTQNIPQANSATWYLRIQTAGAAVYTLDHGLIAIVPGLPTIPF